MQDTIVSNYRISILPYQVYWYTGYNCIQIKESNSTLPGILIYRIQLYPSKGEQSYPPWYIDIQDTTVSNYRRVILPSQVYWYTGYNCIQLKESNPTLPGILIYRIQLYPTIGEQSYPPWYIDIQDTIVSNYRRAILPSQVYWYTGYNCIQL